MNDSKGDCGSRLDRHDHIGKGKIGLAGFRNVVNDPRLAKVPKILETPKGEDDDGNDLDALNLNSAAEVDPLIRPKRRCAMAWTWRAVVSINRARRHEDTKAKAINLLLSGKSFRLPSQTVTFLCVLVPSCL
jgi:hypothetical protein